MSWQMCLDEGRARSVAPDIERARGLLAMCEGKMTWLKGQKITDSSASPILANYFDVLSELCDAILSFLGFRVSASSRDCIVFFLKDKLKEELVAETFDRYRKIRNRINYYGKLVSLEAASAGAKEIAEAYGRLKTKHAKF
jgi:uncharacterized protein YutE (UPF0331/DUF86 family)